MPFKWHCLPKENSAVVSEASITHQRTPGMFGKGNTGEGQQSIVLEPFRVALPGWTSAFHMWT